MVNLESMSRKIVMQVFTITAAEKHTLVLDLMLNFDEVSGALNVSQGHQVMVCFERMSRKITMQGFTLAAITAAEKHSIVLDSTLNLDEVSGALNEPRREKTCLRGFGPGPTQTGLYNHRRWLEA